MHPIAPHFHSRHIPREWLDFDAPTARVVERNGLCDVLQPDNLRALADLGVEVIETRAVWYESEAAPGIYDWRRLERDIERIEHAGLRAGVFCWFQHAPTWYAAAVPGHTRLRCLEHGADSRIVSLWDERTLPVYERLYAALAEHFAGRIAHLQIGIYGDYGEIAYPSGVKHYLWSPRHGHHGFWCADDQARRSFAAWLAEKYGSLPGLNRAWGASFQDWDDDLLPALPLARNPLARKLDLSSWYTGSLLTFTDAVCRIARRYFPGVSAGIPAGFPDEELPVGQIKSLVAKVAARYGINVRWTGCAYFKDYAVSNAAARRLASAAHFYGASFGTEAALVIERDNAANALYESLSNGAAIIHNDPQNIMRAQDIEARLHPQLFVSPPQSRLAVYYPLEGEMLGWPAEESTGDVRGELFEAASPYLATYYRRAAALRRVADYHICDSHMIGDGYLERLDHILFLVSGPLPEEAARRLLEWQARGGQIWVREGVQVTIIETGEPLAGQAGQRFLSLPKDLDESALPFAPYAALRRRLGTGAGTFVTIHEDQVSSYRAGEDALTVASR